MKVCKYCKIKKDFSEFSKRKANKDGYNTKCKECIKRYNKYYYQENRDSIIKQVKEYSDSNKEKIKEYQKQYRKENAKILSEKEKVWRENNKVIVSKVRKSHYSRIGKKQHTEWVNNNKSKVRGYQFNTESKRRVKIKSGISGKDINIWLDQQPKICVYCGDTCKERYHIDHITPLAKNGTHTIDNLAITCSSCNLSKNDKELIFWFAFKQLVGKED